MSEQTKTPRPSDEGKGTPAAPGAEVAPREVTPSAVIRPEDAARMFLDGAVVEDRDTDADPQVQIVAQILSAQTPDEVLAAFDATPAAELVGRAITITGVRWNRSDFEEGNPFYALVEYVQRDTGEAGVFTTGATRLMAQLFQFEQRGWFPQDVVVDKARKPTKNGYYPFFLRR